MEDDEIDENEDDAVDDQESSSSDSTMVIDESAVIADGPEVKPLRTSGSSRPASHSGGILNVVDEYQASGSSVTVDDNTDSAGSGGRLRFFLAGRCVLELAHDTDGRGRPKQWTQAAIAGQSTRPTTWIPSTAVIANENSAAVQQSDTDKCEDLSPSPKTSSSSSSPSPESAPKLVVKDVSINRLLDSTKVSNSFLPFALLRRFTHSTSNDCYGHSATALRRAARRPFRLFQGTSVSGNDNPAAKGVIMRHAKRTFTQRAQRLDWLAYTLMKRHITPKVSSDVDDPRSPERSMKVESPRIAETQCVVSRDNIINTNAKPASIIAALTSFPFGQHVIATNKQEEFNKEIQRGIQQRNQTGNINSRVKTGSSTRKFGWHRSRMDSGRDLDSASSVERERVPSPIHRTQDPPLLSSTSPPTPQRASQRRGARGRTIGEAVRNFVIREILDLGGDPGTKYVPRGVFTEVGLRHKVDATTTYRWWLKYCNGLREALCPEQRTNSHSQERSPSSSNFGNRLHQIAADGDSAQASISSEIGRTNRRISSSSGSPINTDTAYLSMDNRSSVTYIPRNFESSVTDPILRSASTLTLASKNNVNNWPLLSLPSQPSSSFQHNDRRRRQNHRHRHRHLSNDLTTTNSAIQMSADRPHPVILPVGVCPPYVWNVDTSTASSVYNKIHGNRSIYSSSGERKTIMPHQMMDEPLDLTMPKKRLRSADDDETDEDNEKPLSLLKPLIGERHHVSM